MEWSLDLDVASLTGRMAELFAPVQLLTISVTIGIALDDEGRILSGALPKMHSYEVLGDSKSVLRMSRRPSGTFRLDRLDHKHPLFREIISAIVATSTTTDSLAPSDYEGMDNAVAEIVPAIAISMGRFLPEGIVKEEVQNSQSQLSFFPISKGSRKEDLAAALYFFIPRVVDELLKGLSQTITERLSRFQYLGPLRSYPPRHLAFLQDHNSNWLAGGGYAWEVLKRDQKVREEVNTWLGSSDRLQTPYTLRVIKYAHLKEALALIFLSFEEYYSEIYDNSFIARVYKDGKSTDEEDEVTLLKLVSPEKLYEIATRGISEEGLFEKLEELVMVDKKTNTMVSHRDVGIGISQVIPVLVSAYASKNKFIAIEQPEIHLHPALQADLGDVFIQSALGENQNHFLIETHSEHLLLRILRRIRETAEGTLPKDVVPIKPEHVSVLYVDSGKKGAEVIHIPVNEEGEFDRPWPKGFFAERAKELF